MRLPQSTYDTFNENGWWPARVRCQDCPTELVSVADQTASEAWLDAHAAEFHTDDDLFTIEFLGPEVPPDPEIPEEE